MTSLADTVAAQSIKTRILNVTAEIALFDEHRADEFAKSKWDELDDAIEMVEKMGIDLGELMGADEQRFHFTAIGAP